jgi:hypothetical protein
MCDHYVIGWASITMAVTLDSPTASADGSQVPPPKNDTPEPKAKAAPKKPKALAKQTAKDPKQADAANAEKQAKEMVALGARVMEKFRCVISDSDVCGKDWAAPMVASVKQRTDDLQQRIKDNLHVTLAVPHVAMSLQPSHTRIHGCCNITLIMPHDKGHMLIEDMKGFFTRLSVHLHSMRLRFVLCGRTYGLLFNIAKPELMQV